MNVFYFGEENLAADLHYGEGLLVRSLGETRSICLLGVSNTNAILDGTELRTCSSIFMKFSGYAADSFTNHSCIA